MRLLYANSVSLAHLYEIHKVSNEHQTAERVVSIFHLSVASRICHNVGLALMPDWRCIQIGAWMLLPSFTLPQPWGGCNHDDTVIGLYPFSFTQAKLLFMAIRKLQFPEATVSQAASYCTTPGLWCRAQTLSPPPPPPLLLFLLLHFASPLCWFSELLFLSENLCEATARKETRERDREGERGKQRANEERERKTVILLKLWSMIPACVCHARCRQTGRLYWFAPIFQS